MQNEEMVATLQELGDPDLLFMVNQLENGYPLTNYQWNKVKRHLRDLNTVTSVETVDIFTSKGVLKKIPARPLKIETPKDRRLLSYVETMERKQRSRLAARAVAFRILPALQTLQFIARDRKKAYDANLPLTGKAVSAAASQLAAKYNNQRGR